MYFGTTCTKDRNEASKLFKEAADFGYADVQVRYAFSLILDNSEIDEEEFTKYIRKAAENNNISAQYNLGYLL
jgi:TPR repeat protein